MTNSQGAASLGLADARWRKAERSSNTGANCVELATKPDVGAVRDSKNSSGAVLTFGATAFAGFLSAVKAGRCDR